MRSAALLLARAAGRLSRAAGSGGGTTLPGRILLAARPDAVPALAEHLRGRLGLVSATNGKTTTVRLVAAGLRATGARVRTNRAGANLRSGVVSALVAEDGAWPRSDAAVFEVDEFALPEVARGLPPRALLLMNLFRDQLDRFGELEEIAERWRRLVADLPGETTVIVNADDPLVYDLAAGRPGSVTFGIDDTSVALAGLPHAADSVTCRACGRPLHHDAVLLGHMGHWRCPACGWARPRPDVRVTAVRLAGAHGSDVRVETPAGPLTAHLALPGLHNVSNAAAACALLWVLGAGPDAMAAALSSTPAAFGRSERVPLAGRELVLLLSKNPAGANENVRTALLDPEPLHLLVSLNDGAADGRDVSWIWDVDVEALVGSVRRVTVSGERAGDLALRLRYAGLDRSLVRVMPDPGEALDAALADTPTGGRLYVLPTYTAMLALRAVLEARGATGAFWEDGR